MPSTTAKLGLVALSLVAGAASAAQAKPTPARNVVLVHGAFADETSWDKVAAILRGRGYRVTQVANPLTSLADDVAATREALAQQKGPTVLVGHSWGGVVIGEAGADAKVRSLVYVAAFAPDRGERLADFGKDAPPSDGQRAFRTDARGFVTVDPAAFPTVFAGDLPAAESAGMAGGQLPIAGASFATPATVAAWHAKPTWYAISADDRMIPTSAQTFFAQRMKARSVTLRASHASLVSRPAEIAALIERAAGQD